MSPAELLPHARATVRFRRIVWRVLGAALLAPSLAALAIVTLAAPWRDALALGGIVAVVGVLPGAWMWWATRRPVDAHPLVVALATAPGSVRIEAGYLQTLFGYRRTYTVWLADGSGHAVDGGKA